MPIDFISPDDRAALASLLLTVEAGIGTIVDHGRATERAAALRRILAICDECRGTGWEDMDMVNARDCRACNGTGERDGKRIEELET